MEPTPIVMVDLDKIIFKDPGPNEDEFSDARFRVDLDESSIAELAASINEHGLLNPIILHKDFKLVAGRRRIEAYKTLKRPQIEARFFEDLDMLTQRILEFDENHKRRQFSRQEEAKAIATIHRLRNESVKEKDWGAKVTLEDTAKLLGVSTSKVAEDIDLAKKLESGLVSDRVSKKGAMTTFKRERELELVRELSRRKALRSLQSVNLHIETPKGTIAERRTFENGIVYLCDCRDFLKRVPPESFDLIVTDPPWGIDVGRASAWAKQAIFSYTDTKAGTIELMQMVIPELNRVLKPSCHLYMWIAIDEAAFWVDLLIQSGFIVRRRPLIWFKSDNASISDVYTTFLTRYEACLFAFKPDKDGTKRIFNEHIHDAWAVPRPLLKFHENEKPKKSSRK